MAAHAGHPDGCPSRSPVPRFPPDEDFGQLGLALSRRFVYHHLRSGRPPGGRHDSRPDHTGLEAGRPAGHHCGIRSCGLCRRHGDDAAPHCSPIDGGRAGQPDKLRVPLLCQLRGRHGWFLWLELLRHHHDLHPCRRHGLHRPDEPDRRVHHLHLRLIQQSAQPHGCCELWQPKRPQSPHCALRHHRARPAHRRLAAHRARRCRGLGASGQLDI